GAHSRRRGSEQAQSPRLIHMAALTSTYRIGMSALLPLLGKSSPLRGRKGISRRDPGRPMWPPGAKLIASLISADRHLLFHRPPHGVRCKPLDEVARRLRATPPRRQLRKKRKTSQGE